MVKYKLLRTFGDGSKLLFNRGKFDNYKVSFLKNDKLTSPTDVQFFNFALKYHIPFDRYLYIANQINKHTEFNEIAIPLDNLEQEKLLSAYAAAVMAEEQRQYSRLGKRIKLLGYYQLLVLGFPPKEAAIWSKGKWWEDIAKECERYGF